MEKAGLWRLFFLTGRPEVYLAIQAQDREKEHPAALTAFAPLPNRNTERGRETGEEHAQQHQGAGPAGGGL